MVKVIKNKKRPNKHISIITDEWFLQNKLWRIHEDTMETTSLWFCLMELLFENQPQVITKEVMGRDGIPKLKQFNVYSMITPTELMETINNNCIAPLKRKYTYPSYYRKKKELIDNK